MKLRNKKTGEIVEWDGVHITSDNDGEMFDSIAELIEEWEDYKLTEPLIKDEKIRNAVIAWAKANSQRTSVVYQKLDGTHSCISFIDFGGLNIEFNTTIDGLTSGKIYKFEELCGEEK